jgi:hypothetical protein
MLSNPSKITYNDLSYMLITQFDTLIHKEPSFVKRDMCVDEKIPFGNTAHIKIDDKWKLVHQIKPYNCVIVCVCVYFVVLS